MDILLVPFNFKDFKNTIYFSGEWNQSSSTNKLNIGNKFNWNRISLMGGLSTSKNVVEYSAGFGINLNRYQITYGIRFGSQNLGVPQIISFQLKLP